MISAEGTLCDLTISDLARGGAGVARDDSGRVVFVPHTAPGDRVRVRVTFEKKNYGQGELVELLEAAPVRQTPKCPVFGRCGGCQWQHLPYELQWKTKAGGVRHAWSRVGLAADVEWEEFPAEQIWEYRNRVQLRGFGTELGFYSGGSHTLVPVSRCEIARTEINSALESVRSEGMKLPKPYKVELAVEPSGELRRVWNAPHGAAGFRQIHDAQNEKLRSWVARHITGGRPVLDLFGGSGNLSLALAPKAPIIHCVDVGAPLARPPGVPEHVHFHRSSLLTWLLRKGRKLSPGAWSVITDPPREGLAGDLPEVARVIEGIGGTEWIAVGCDPDAWVRDVSRLLKRGWRVEKLAVFDFFPQTPHVESAAVLKYGPQ